MYSLPCSSSSCPPRYLTMFGCRSRRIRSTSFTISLSCLFLDASKFNSLMATISPLAVFIPLYTIPNAPCPIFSPSRHSPRRTLLLSCEEEEWEPPLAEDTAEQALGDLPLPSLPPAEDDDATGAKTAAAGGPTSPLSPSPLLCFPSAAAAPPLELSSHLWRRAIHSALVNKGLNVAAVSMLSARSRTEALIMFRVPLGSNGSEMVLGRQLLRTYAQSVRSTPYSSSC
mmetsp:Transcript_7216/g.13455  ORF Transcript_7216/g.13455 Transcript_7216/m.13455 type:complete len:228 (+) Transcript_7216:352-1035(+)